MANLNPLRAKATSRIQAWAAPASPRAEPSTADKRGKIWLWNGKTNKVLVLDVANRKQYAAVRQGDPDISMTAVVDGKRYNVASPGYAEAIAKKQAAQAPKEPTTPPGLVCAGWGCPKPGPRTSTIEQEGGGQKPKSPPQQPSSAASTPAAAGNRRTAQQLLQSHKARPPC